MAALDLSTKTDSFWNIREIATTASLADLGTTS